MVTVHVGCDDYYIPKTLWRRGRMIIRYGRWWMLLIGRIVRKIDKGMSDEWCCQALSKEKKTLYGESCAGQAQLWSTQTLSYFWIRVLHRVRYSNHIARRSHVVGKECARLIVRDTFIVHNPCYVCMHASLKKFCYSIFVQKSYSWCSKTFGETASMENGEELL